jgi:hypothetical protein
MPGNYGFVGKKQTGKTSKMVLQIRNVKPLIVLDTDGELGFLGEVAYTLDDVRELWNDKQYRIIVDADQWGEADMEGLNEFVWQLIEQLSLKNIEMHYAITEIWEYAPSRRLPSAGFDDDGKALPSYLKRLLKRGDKRGLNIYWDSQRPSETNTLVPSQTNELFVFRLTGGADLKYMSDIIRGIEEPIAGLAAHQYIHVHGEPLVMEVGGPDVVDFDLHKTRQKPERKDGMEMEL